jgi:enoyl-CoA hydratase/carnithine racemase
MIMAYRSFIYEVEAMAQARCMETPDFHEGYRAFVEKRPLRFNQP